MMASTRRQFLLRSSSCAAHLALASLAMPSILRGLWTDTAQDQVVAETPFGALLGVADGVWALISTPLNGDRTTLCNGGIIAGRDSVLIVEGFYTVQGAEWLAEQSRVLTGRHPAHIVLTHYHADHTNGVAGYVKDALHPTTHSTEVTRRLTISRNKPADSRRTAVLERMLLLPPGEPTILDLGGKTVRIVPRGGHTESDVTVELDDPAVVFCGDLVWNMMFPNYADAAPSLLSASVRSLPRTDATVYVPGHGPLARPEDLLRYLVMLDSVEQAARDAHAKGLSAEEASKGFSLKPSLGEWVMFSTSFYQRAFSAWYRELES